MALIIWLELFVEWFVFVWFGFGFLIKDGVRGEFLQSQIESSELKYTNKWESLFN